MAIVRKSNVELTVSDHLVDEYLEMGYSLLDENGNVIRRKQTDSELIVELNEKNSVLESENSSLKATVEKLTNEINALKASHISSNEVSDDNSSNIPTKKARANKSD